MNDQQKQYYNVDSISSLQQRSAIQNIVTNQAISQAPLSAPIKSDDLKQSASNKKKTNKKNQQISSEVQEIKNSEIEQIQQDDDQAYQQQFQGFNDLQIGESSSSTFTNTTIGDIKLDQYGNQQGQEFDLGKDGAFNDFSVLGGIFYHEVATAWDQNVGGALKKQGFRVFMTQNEIEFIAKLQEQTYDVAIIVSTMNFANPGKEGQFAEAVYQHYKSGRGLFLFGDNDPYNVHANLVLPKLADTKIQGCESAQKLLKFGPDPTQTGYFDQNTMIFAGINVLYEGHTICYPTPLGSLQVLATGTDGKPCICQKDRTENGGRIILDTGFTKLYLQWDTAGQARYIVNACVYLVDIEGRFGGDEPTMATRIDEQDLQHKLIQDPNPTGTEQQQKQKCQIL